jgi:hypothetical protein
MDIKRELLELCRAQDDVTHCNEAGLIEECRKHQARRDCIRSAIEAEFLHMKCHIEALDGTPL